MPGRVWVEVKGLDELEKLADALGDAHDDFLEAVAEETAEEVARLAPGGPDGSAGRAVEGRVERGDIRIGSFSFPGARALERGAYIVPKRNQALRLEGAGGLVTKRPVRLPPRRYHERGFREATKIARRLFAARFGELGLGSRVRVRGVKIRS